MTHRSITATPADHWRAYEVDAESARNILGALRKSGIDHRTGPASNARLVIYCRAWLNRPGVDQYEK